jgi:hypothetical protein
MDDRTMTAGLMLCMWSWKNGYPIREGRYDTMNDDRPRIYSSIDVRGAINTTCIQPRHESKD